MDRRMTPTQPEIPFHPPDARFRRAEIRKATEHFFSWWNAASVPNVWPCGPNREEQKKRQIFPGSLQGHAVSR